MLGFRCATENMIILWAAHVLYALKMCTNGGKLFMAQVCNDLELLCYVRNPASWKKITYSQVLILNTV